MDLRWRDVLKLRLRALFRRARADADLTEELQFHVDQQIEEYVAGGMSRDEARTLALRRIGTLDVQRELCRDARGVNWIQHLLRDVLGGARLLGRDRGFTTVAILSLALGIGANATIFQLLDSLRLRSLPVVDPGQLVIVDVANRAWTAGDYSGRYAAMTSSLFERISANSEPFSGILAWNQTTMDLATRGESRFVENALYVSGNYFELLGVGAAAGRVFTAADDTLACPTRGVVLSHAFWQREYGAARTAIGASLTLNNQPFTIVGVAARGFHGIDVGRSFDLAAPICADAIINPGSTRRIDGTNWWLGIMARLKPGWSLERANDHLASLSPAIFETTVPAQLSADSASQYRSFRLTAEPGAGGFSELRARYDVPLWLLLGVAGVVLLIACANLANLLLARMSAREREMAVRLALGASRARLTQQVLVESLLLAGAGAIAGAWLAPSFSRGIISLITSEANPLFVDLSPDWRVIGFLAGVTVMTTLLFGLAPALKAARVPPGSVIKGAGRGLIGRASLRGRHLLVGTQVALSLVLLVVGLLFARSLYNLLTEDAGFEPSGILEADVDMRPLRLNGAARATLRDDILRRLRETPGVAGVATVTSVPFVGNWWRNVYFPAEGGGHSRVMTRFNRVSGGYFATVSTPLVAGRDFDPAIDTPTALRVAIVNQAFVEKHLHGATALGVEFRPEGAKDGEPGALIFRIIGVVGNTKHGGLREDFDPFVYVAESQMAEAGAYFNFFLRSRRSAASLMPAVRAAMPQINAGMAFHFHDVGQVTRETIAQDRLMALLCGAFAVLGAVLATIGVYGVMAYTLARRRAEIGVRLALGASRPAIVRMVIRQTVLVVTAGVIAGTLIALAGSRVAASLLYELEPADPVTYLAAGLSLLAVALTAAYIPAYRVSRTNPTIALRQD